MRARARRKAAYAEEKSLSRRQIARHSHPHLFSRGPKQAILAPDTSAACVHQMFRQMFPPDVSARCFRQMFPPNVSFADVVSYNLFDHDLLRRTLQVLARKCD